jgi:hypothetical protein
MNSDTFQGYTNVMPNESSVLRYFFRITIYIKGFVG